MDHSIPCHRCRRAVRRRIARARADRPSHHGGGGRAGFHGGKGISGRCAGTGRAARAELLRLFQLPQSETRKLWRQKFDPSHSNVYRGWFPLQTGFLTAKEGIDMGADVVYGASVVHSDDPLREATPLPSAQALPGWRESVAAYYRAMDKVSQALDARDCARLVLGGAFLRSGIRQGAVDLAPAALSDSNRCRANRPGGSQSLGDPRRRPVLRQRRSARRFRILDAAGAGRSLRAAGAPSRRHLARRAAHPTTAWRSISARSSSAGAAGASRRPNIA